MERAHYIQERSLPELKDFLEKKIFSKDEVRQIVKKRSSFEAALVRRIARKSDYLKYIAYEMGLEALRKKRVKRLHLSGGPPSISDYALVRKQFFIFERAVSKFKSDLGLWVQYIQLAKKEGAKGLASRICARALQLHPTAPSIFIIASAHELDQFSPTAARALLQRGLRINPDSVELWTEYLKMELTYIETLRRRWAVLGIEASSASIKGKGKGAETNGSAPDEESDESRRQVMEGAIVSAVMSSAVKALPTIQLFKSLQSLLTTFPIPTTLRNALLDRLHSHLAQRLPHSAAARFLHATRGLSAELEGEELVDALKDANDVLLKGIRAQNEGSTASDTMRRELGAMYASWVEEWTEKLDEENIREYLLLSLQSLASKLPSNILSPAILTTILKLTLASTAPSSHSKAQKLAHKYTTSEKFLPSGNDARVWRARLDVELSVNTSDQSMDADEKRSNLLQVWSQARKLATGSEEDITSLWLWGIPAHEDDKGRASLLHESQEKQNALFDELFLASQATTSAQLHDAIVLRYLAIVHPTLPASASTSKTSSSHQSLSRSNPRKDDLTRLLGSGKVRPSTNFWGEAFELEASFFDQSLPDENDEPSAITTTTGFEISSTRNRHQQTQALELQGVRAVLETIYTRWRDSGKARVQTDAGLKYAEWLLRFAEDGAAASTVIRGALASCAGGEPSLRDEVERRWGDVLAAHEAASAAIIDVDASVEGTGKDNVDFEMETD